MCWNGISVIMHNIRVVMHNISVFMLLHRPIIKRNGALFQRNECRMSTYEISAVILLGAYIWAV